RDSGNDFENPDHRKNSWIRTNNQQTRKKDYIKNPKNINGGFGVYEDDTADYILNRVLDRVRDLYSTVNPITNQRENKPLEDFLQGWKELIENYDQHSMRRFLKEFGGLSENDLQLIGTIENLTSR